MPGRNSRRCPWPSRRMTPLVEALDTRVLLSWGGVGPRLGSYVAPAANSPRASRPSLTIDPHTTINHFLGNRLGPGLDRVARQVELQGGASNNEVAGRVLSQRFVHAILSRKDTYTLLGSAVPAGGGGLQSDVYAATGPVLTEALRSGLSQPAPNAPRTVPGLRLVDSFGGHASFGGAQAGTFLRAFRVAADRKVFALSSRQSDLVVQGIARFEDQVNQLNNAAAFRPAVPAPAPALPEGRLNGTLEVSLGAFRNLAGIDPTLAGLQLPGIGNFAGRIDVGYVFDRAGNFGIALTARGPLASAPTGVASANAIGGDIRIEVSNAPNLAALNGRRSVEGLTQGSPSAGGLETARYASGISTFAASTGYGAGFEFGTGTAYTQVIPLGNVYALVPEFPGRR